VCDFLEGLIPFQLQFRPTLLDSINSNGAERPQDSGQQQHQREPWDQDPIRLSQLLEDEIHHSVWSIWLIWFVLFIWLIWFIWSLWLIWSIWFVWFIWFIL